MPALPSTADALRSPRAPAIPRPLWAALTLALALGACHQASPPSASDPPAAAPAPQAPSAMSAAAPTPAAYTPPAANELYRLVAPIALYPDKLVAQVLAASTFPDQLTAAHRWLAQNPQLRAGPLADAANQQPWDPSVKGLTAFRRVLDQLAGNIGWTTALGQAYYNDPTDVMNAIQVMRQRARSAGELKNSSQLKVVQSSAPPAQAVNVQPGVVVQSMPVVVEPPPTYITIEPAQPDVVYVPRYDPQVVYGAPVPYYAGYSYTPPLQVAEPVPVQPVVIGALAFGAGVIVSSALQRHDWGWRNWDLRWGSRPPAPLPGGWDRDRPPPSWQRPAVVYNNNIYMPQPGPGLGPGPRAWGGPDPRLVAVQQEQQRQQRELAEQAARQSQDQQRQMQLQQMQRDQQMRDMGQRQADEQRRMADMQRQQAQQQQRQLADHQREMQSQQQAQLAAQAQGREQQERMRQTQQAQQDQQRQQQQAQRQQADMARRQQDMQQRQQQDQARRQQQAAEEQQRQQARAQQDNRQAQQQAQAQAQAERERQQNLARDQQRQMQEQVRQQQQQMQQQAREQARRQQEQMQEQSRQQQQQAQEQARRQQQQAQEQVRQQQQQAQEQGRRQQQAAQEQMRQQQQQQMQERAAQQQREVQQRMQDQLRQQQQQAQQRAREAQPGPGDRRDGPRGPGRPPRPGEQPS